MIGAIRIRSLATTMLLSVALGFPMADVLAQGDDYEPPLIEHEVVADGSPGVTQEFTASVVDDQSLAEVTLFYRFEGDPKFKSVTMQPIASSSVHTASIDTRRGDDRDIEYYIRATDRAGNRVIKGYAFDPLIRAMGGAVAIAQSKPAEKPAAAGKSRRNLVYIGLGVLAVGAIAAAASSGGGDDGGSSNDFTIVLDPPTQ